MTVSVHPAWGHKVHRNLQLPALLHGHIPYKNSQDTLIGLRESLEKIPPAWSERAPEKGKAEIYK